MYKRHICKSKSFVCYRTLNVYENPRRKTLLTRPVPNILKQLIEINYDVNFIFPVLCGASFSFHCEIFIIFCYDYKHLSFSNKPYQKEMNLTDDKHLPGILMPCSELLQVTAWQSTGLNF